MAQPPNLLQGSEPVETAELHFKLYCKLKVCESEKECVEGHCSLLAVSQYYGLIFVRHLNGFSVIKTKSLSPTIDLEKFPKRNIYLNLKPTHLLVDFSQKILAVSSSFKSSSLLYFYDIQTFGSNAKDVFPVRVLSIGKIIQNFGVKIVDLTWQPNPDGILMICLSDGSVLALSQGVKEGPVFTIPKTTQATCFCWSPKGKQIVIGTATGALSQYKPDLKIVKTLPPPPLFNGAVMVVSVLWISSYQFAVAYSDGANPESFPVITIVNAPKNEPISVINYEDITYSSTLFRNHQIYMTHQSAWNLIFVSSANSIEVAVLHSKDGSSWEQWLLGDASRAELPLDPDRQETFPLGWAFDFTSQETIPWGEGTLPPMPRILLLSDEGLLCVFNIVNVKENAPQLCAPPKEDLDDSCFVASAGDATDSSLPPAEPPPQPTKSLLGSPPVFGNSKPTCAFESSLGFGTLEAAQPPAAIPQVSLPAKEEFAFFPDKNVTESAVTKQQEILPEKANAASGSIVKKADAASGSIDKKAEEVAEAVENLETVPQGESPSPGTPELAAVDDSVYLNALEEEIEHFNSEMQQLLAKVRNLDTNLGSEEQKLKTKKSIDEMHDFWMELKETTKGQSGEVHDVVMDLMEAFAWLEDAKSRNLQRKNPSYIELKKSEELDPLSARYMREIFHLKFYIERQLKQLTSYLEKEWMNYQENYRNEVKSKMTAPSLEEVYKTMHLQLKILDKQKKLVEELKEKIAARRGKIKSQSFLISGDGSVANRNVKNELSELSKLAENLLQLKIKEKENSSHAGAWEMLKVELSAISERSKKLTPNKLAALRDALSECEMVKIRPVKATLESRAFLRCLAVEKSESKARKSKSAVDSEQPKIEIKSLNTNAQVLPPPEAKAEPEAESDKVKMVENSVLMAKAEGPVEKPLTPSAVPSFPKPEGKSPLESLSGIVSSIGKKSEAKAPPAFVFGNMNYEKAEPAKEAIVFDLKAEQKQETPNPTQFCTFPTPKTGDLVFLKKDLTVFGAKPLFGFTNSTPALNPKSDLTKTPAPNLTILPVTGAPTTTASQFAFPFTTTAANPTNLPKMNLSFPGKEQGSGFGTPTTTSIFSAPSSAAITFCTASPNFSDVNKSTISTFASPTLSLVSTPKTSSEAPVQPSGFTFTSAVENKSTPVASPVATPIKPTSETEEVDVEKVDEPVNKPETLSEKSKDSSKGTVASSVFVSPSAPVSVSLEATVATISSPSVILTSPSQSSTPITSIFAKPVGTTPVVTSTTSAENSSTSVVVSPTVTTTSAKNVASGFSFSTSSIAFGQTTTTTSPATTKSIFGTPTTTTTPTAWSVFGTPTTTKTVLSTTPTANIFGGSTSTPPTSDLFGGSAKPIFGQASTPSTTSEFIFGATTPTTNAFGQVSTPAPTAAFDQVQGSAPPSTTIATTCTNTAAATTTTFGKVSSPSSTTFGQVSTPPSTAAFGQKPDSVAQAANLFGHLSAGNNQSVFGAPSTTSTATPNIFSTPKNIFSGSASTTTASLFGTTSSSIFPQTTSIFGRPTTSPNVFGQPQTSTTSSFFGQSACSPFGSGAAVTSNQNNFESGGFNKPLFGKSAFGQSTSTNSSFGGINWNSSTTSSNVFQTPTTSTTFGSAPSGPFTGGTSSFGSSFGNTTSTFQKPLGSFGSSPVFRGAPVFGSSATFGGSPSFGSLPTFGNTSQGTFGQTTTGLTTFENLANQNTVGFGNLAQRSQSQGFGGGFGSNTFENKSAFGGNSFSSWRSK